MTTRLLIILISACFGFGINSYNPVIAGGLVPEEEMNITE